MRLRTRRDYQRAAQGSSRYVGNWIILDIRTCYNPPKIGISVTRRYGKSHERNRFKRLAREAFRLLYPTLNQKITIVVRPRTAAHQASMQDVQHEIQSFISLHCQKQQLNKTVS